MGKLSDYLIETKNIKWNDKEEFTYIDLSSIDRENNSILATTVVNKNNAPSRARQLIKKKDILFGTTRPLLKRYYFVEEEYDGQLCSTGFCVLRTNEEKILPKWIYYNIMTSKFLEFVKINEKGTSYPSISDSTVKEYKIPVPPIPVQEHIVSILDKFDELVNDISGGIPKEIELRQKEYEFYREKLLNFPR
ncbi:restriction endonuclease subunit S [uncultured Finegoldia sp.]|uniref:restriction endonuclease subunit S n=1 Tax=uncultured Finegoldia sp. TaxID=328009 RepID=UPI002620756E|nr:restriction endonuclease subunit S [uncultured Finegoldia sp.]